MGNVYFGVKKFKLIHESIKGAFKKFLEYVIKKNQDFKIFHTKIPPSHEFKYFCMCLYTMPISW